MKKLFTGKMIYVTGILLILVLVMMVYVLIRIGKAYQLGLAGFSGQTQKELTPVSVNKIRKVGIKKRNSNSCIEVTPDGVVRIYEQCGDELQNTQRLQNPNSIFKLFDLISQKKWTEVPPEGDYYQVTVETDEGTKTYYFGGSGGEGGGIIDVIEEIIDQTQPSPSPFVSPAVSTVPGSSAYATPQPFPTVPGSSPAPGASPTGATQAFSCAFVDPQPGDKKPANVSNIICTSDPSPVP